MQKFNLPAKNDRKCFLERVPDNSAYIQHTKNIFEFALTCPVSEI